MENRLTNSELKVMNVLWNEGDTPAKIMVKILDKEISWKKSTTYTVINRCVDKGLIEYKGDFVCHAVISKEEAQKNETNQLINNMYDGSADKLVASLLGRENLTAEDIEQLRKIMNELK